SLEMAGRYAHISPEAAQLAHSFLPGALTLVMPKKEVVPSLLVAGRDTVGIRVPDHKVILDLTFMTELPITATSANVSGQPTPYSVPEVINLLGGAVEQVALILDQGPIPSRGLSTIVDLTVSPPQLLRQGLVSWLEIRQVLQALQDSASGQA
ncbi:MAG TPA: L-threonylcarbamoyladenylate synthase, partial [Dehalococcoidales bacterium]|nr:L-threonylcarbamoyladenylate synthase [Dehalococcoidales bacterium]